jgi:hypothetical protein
MTVLIPKYDQVMAFSKYFIRTFLCIAAQDLVLIKLNSFQMNIHFDYILLMQSFCLNISYLCQLHTLLLNLCNFFTIFAFIDQYFIQLFDL